jgi:hypothetical protein
MKSKPIIIVGLIILLIVLAISIITVGRPQQKGSEAQSIGGTSQQCQIDGGFVTDQASCSGADKQILNVISDGSSTPGGDSQTQQVCCRNITIATPTPAKSCPEGTTETDQAQCPADRVVTPISSTADGGDSQFVQPGIVCCRPQGLTPTTPNSPSLTPTPSTCPLPDAPAISVSDVQIICPNCNNTTQ